MDALLQLYSQLEVLCQQRMAAGEAGKGKALVHGSGWAPPEAAPLQGCMRLKSLHTVPAWRPHSAKPPRCPCLACSGGVEREAAGVVQDALRYRMTRLVRAWLHALLRACVLVLAA